MSPSSSAVTPSAGRALLGGVMSLVGTAALLYPPAYTAARRPDRRQSPPCCSQFLDSCTCCRLTTGRPKINEDGRHGLNRSASDMNEETASPFRANPGLPATARFCTRFATFSRSVRVAGPMRSGTDFAPGNCRNGAGTPTDSPESLHAPGTAASLQNRATWIRPFPIKVDQPRHAYRAAQCLYSSNFSLALKGSPPQKAAKAQ